MMVKMLIVCDSTRRHESTEGRMTISLKFLCLENRRAKFFRDTLPMLIEKACASSL